MPAVETPTYTIKELQDLDQQFRNAQTAADGFAAQRREAILGLVRQGVRQAEIARACGINHQRISQIVRAGSES